LTKNIVESAARRYHSTRYASEALGVAQWSFLRACDRFGIMPPRLTYRRPNRRKYEY
jgi:hypothetical protein